MYAKDDHETAQHHLSHHIHRREADNKRSDPFYQPQSCLAGYERPKPNSTKEDPMSQMSRVGYVVGRKTCGQDAMALRPYDTGTASDRVSIPHPLGRRAWYCRGSSAAGPPTIPGK
jgi:hypothetical protein